MSNFRQEWPQSTSMQDHLDYVQDGLQVINDRLLLPVDGRWDVAYGSLVLGSQDGTVFAEGQPGAGKTAFGNIVFGEDIRVDVASTDTAETLEGYESPVDHKFVQPKLHLDRDDMRLFLNEVSHLRDTGPLHKYWDAEDLLINGSRYDLTNASMYLTANFPDGNRSKKIDPALRSRMGMTVLAGDNGKEIAAQLHGMDSTTPLDKEYQDGLLPHAKDRSRIRTAMHKSSPLSKQAGQYMANVLDGMSTSGLLTPVDLTDKRTSKGWIHAARAQRLVHPENGISGPITAEELARVASLALGSVAILSSRGSLELAEKLGTSDELTKLEKAVLARRITAGIAMREVIDNRDMALHISKDEELAKFMSKRSYASLADNTNADQVIVNTLVGQSSPKGVDNVPSKSRRRSFFGFKRS